MNESVPEQKPRKIDSDTQTASAHVPSPARRQTPQTGDHKQRSPAAAAHHGAPHSGSGIPRGRLGPEANYQSLTSDSTSDSSGKAGSGTSSNSKNSASSTDSVVYRGPSSDDGAPTGVSRSDPPPPPRTDQAPTGAKPGCEATKGRGPQFTDHITSLRNKQQQQQRSRNSEDAPGNEGVAAGEEEETMLGGIKPMQPIVRPSPYAYLRSLPVSLGHPHSATPLAPPSSSMIASPLHRIGAYLSPGRHPGALVGGGGGGGGRFLPRVPHVDVPSDAEGYDVTAGYMSDGDILRSSYLDDVNCGYMSEGGLTQYVKRIQQRFREGMLAVEECMEKSNALANDDRYSETSLWRILGHLWRFYFTYFFTFLSESLEAE